MTAQEFIFEHSYEVKEALVDYSKWFDEGEDQHERFNKVLDDLENIEEDSIDIMGVINSLLIEFSDYTIDDQVVQTKLKELGL
jgi:hypothetical protein